MAEPTTIDLGFQKYRMRENQGRVICAGEIESVTYKRRTPDADEVDGSTSLGWEIKFTCVNTIWRTNDYVRSVDCRIGRMLIIPTQSHQSISKDVFMAEYELLDWVEK